MAVPKKRTSRIRKNKRKAVWKQKGRVAAEKALSLAKSVLKNRKTSFVYEDKEDNNEE